MILIMLPEAERELAEAIDHYNNEQQGLGQDFLSEMEVLLSLIAEGPLHFAKLRRSRTRAAFGKRFPYQIVFALLPDHVRVLAVSHQHRRPNYWRGRT
jgi:plasmid stabilization system protein ParE